MEAITKGRLNTGLARHGGPPLTAPDRPRSPKPALLPQRSEALYLTSDPGPRRGSPGSQLLASNTGCRIPPLPLPTILRVVGGARA